MYLYNKRIIRVQHQQLTKTYNLILKWQPLPDVHVLSAHPSPLEQILLAQLLAPSPVPRQTSPLLALVPVEIHRAMISHTCPAVIKAVAN